MHRHWFSNKEKTIILKLAGGLRRYGAKNVRRNVCRCVVRPGRRLDHRPARPCHRLQFLHVLQPHAGKLRGKFKDFFFCLFFLELRDFWTEKLGL